MILCVVFLSNYLTQRHGVPIKVTEGGRLNDPGLKILPVKSLEVTEDKRR